jgi:hypothetical protein
MLSFFRKLMTEDNKIPLHYAMAAGAVAVALMIALNRLL